MPKLFLHVGLHKTGTTSLQKTFFDHRAQLAEQGLLYPQTGLPDSRTNWGHHDLAYSLRNADTAKNLWQRLRHEADASRLDRLFISSEELSLLPFPGLPHAQPFKLIAEVFEGYEIKLICYLRPQAEMITSLYNHNVKSVGEQRDILDFMAAVAPRLDYQHYLNVAALGLGEKAVEVRRYQKLHMKDGDIISDMADRLGLELPQKDRKRTQALNPGLTADGLAAMLQANRKHAGAPARLKIERTRILSEYCAPAFYPHALLSPDMQQVIEALFRTKNRQIARRFLGRDIDLFEPEPELKPEPASKVAP